MLSDAATTTPRPRPPAKARRSTSSLHLKQQTPPPPYASVSRDSATSAQTLSFPTLGRNAAALMRPRLESLLGSPITMTAQMVGWDSLGDTLGPPFGPEDVSRMNDKSREELTGLLSKADDLIKERESELGVTSAVCKTLYENNVSLKSKHEAFLARIPSTVSSPLHSPTSSMTPLSPHFFATGLPSRRPSTDSVALDNGATYSRHTRRVSVSPADIALLSDQNAELMQQLERLENESTTADQSGRRVLRKLEKEIKELRAELERTQARSAELEEKASVENIQKKKREREARFRALRGKPEPEEEDEGSEREVRDFAPAHPLSSASSQTLIPPATRRTSQIRDSAPSSPIPSTPPPEVNLLTKPRSPHERSSSLSSLGSYETPTSPPEYALISQLLIKIRELEEANTVIREQQAETTGRLQAVQRDAASISKVYECLTGDTNVDIEWEGAPQLDRQPSGDTIRFKSFRRTLDGAPYNEEDMDDVFGGLNQGTARALNFGGGQKMRKSVVGLFDGPRAQPAGHERSHSWGPISPALSTLSLGPLNQPPRTSLARELGETWENADLQNNTQTRHLRLGSLYDIDPPSIPPSPPASHPATLVPEKEPSTGLRTPVSMTQGLQLTLDAPTPESMRYRKMTQTVRARTRRWVNGRFADTLLGPEPEHTHSRSSSSSQARIRARTQSESQAVHRRLVSGLGVVMESFAGGPEGDDAVGLRRERVQESEGAIVVRKRAEPERGLMRVVLELWLWLQFGIIILVFLWAMAKRGPKTVLDEAERRRSRASA